VPLSLSQRTNTSTDGHRAEGFRIVRRERARADRHSAHPEVVRSEQAEPDLELLASAWEQHSRAGSSLERRLGQNASWVYDLLTELANVAKTRGAKIRFLQRYRGKQPSGIWRLATGARVGLAASLALAAMVHGAWMPSLVYADASTYATTVLGDHPAAFYQFADGEGSASFADSSGNGNTATSNGSDRIVAPGPFGESTRALSIGTDGAQAPPLGPMQGDNSRTVELWFKTTDTEDECLLSAGFSSHAQSFSLCLTDGKQYGAPPPNTPGVYLQIWDADIYVPNLALTDGNWHYLAVTLAGSAVNIDVDGSAPSDGFLWNGSAYSAFTAQPFTLPTQPNTASTPVGIGSKGWAGGFVGEIADVAVYPAALTQEQITAHYSAGRPKQEVLLPTVTTTKYEKNKEEKPEPTQCVASQGGLSPSASREATHLSRRVVRGTKRLLRAKSVRVHMAITLCGQTASEAGVAPGTVLSGNGTIDAARARASWTIQLPPSLGGHVLSVISHGSETFLRADGLALNPGKPWIRIRAKEFGDTRRLGFLGTLASDTNPAAEMGVAADTGPEAAARAAVARAGHVSSAPTAAFAAGDSSCNVSGGATLSGPLDLHNDKTIVGRAKAWGDALSTIKSASKDIRSTIKLNRGGRLSSSTVAILKGQTATLTVTTDLCPESQHDSGQDPLASSIPKISSVFALDPCLVGTWQLHEPYEETIWGPSLPLSGSVMLEVASTGVMRLNYLITDVPHEPLRPPQVFDSPPYYYNTTTYSEPGAPSTITGIAMGQVLAPLSTVKQLNSHLVWGITASTITIHIPGQRSEEKGEKLEAVIVPPYVIEEETQPFDYVNEYPEVNIQAWQVHNSTKYECDESNGVGTLKLELPYSFGKEYEFWRPGRRSNG
jgi:hypothetical protein